jgi:hypothetical protein
MERINEFLLIRGIIDYPLNDAGFWSILFFLGLEVLS